MPTRRNFLKNTFFSGLTFCSCGLLEQAHAQYPVSEEKKLLVAKTKDAGNDRHGLFEARSKNEG